MKNPFTCVGLLGLSLYAMLCVNGTMAKPKDFWGVLAISVPILFVLVIEDRNNKYKDEP